MKKLTLLCVIFATCVSCQKDYTCECSTTEKASLHTSPNPQTSLIRAKDKTQANTKCSDKDEESSSYITICKIQ